MCSILQKELHRCCMPWKTAIHGCIRGGPTNGNKQYRYITDHAVMFN